MPRLWDICRLRFMQFPEQQIADAYGFTVEEIRDIFETFAPTLCQADSLTAETNL